MTKGKNKSVVKTTTAKKGNAVSNNSYAARINRISGQVNGIKKMLEDEKNRVEILTQLKAARSALKAIESMILEEHLQDAVLELASGSSAQKSKKISNLKKIFLRAEVN